MQEFFSGLIQTVNRLVWGAPALILILGVGLYLSIRTGFLQLRKLGFSLRTIFHKLRQKPEEGGVSPFQAVCTALAATVGTGNIAGVAGAIAIGGPGAIFWMWVSALLGMAIKYAEVVLAVRYREKNAKGEYLGGPMYYIKNGLGRKWAWLGSLFCGFGVVAAFGVGSTTQVSTVVTGINEALSAFGLSPSTKGNLIMGVVMGLIVALVLLGGAKRIGAVAEYLVPVMSVGYILLSLGVILHNYSAVPQAFASIFAGAFSPSALTGGAVGSFFTAMRIGVSRGVFTNEAGMGTASIAHAGANTKHPAEQGMYGIFEVFADTIVICTMTAIAILCSGVPIPYGMDAGAELTVSAFVQTYGNWVTIFTALAMACFAFATILGWGLYGIRCAEYLFGAGGWKPFAWFHALSTVLGAVVAPALIWQLAESVNGLMAIPNLIAVLILSPEVFRLTKSYFRAQPMQVRPMLRAGRRSASSPDTKTSDSEASA